MNEVEGEPRQVQGGLTDEQKRENVIQLAFGGRPERFEGFCGLLRDAVPEATAVVLRGSAVTGMRWDGRAPFDGDGPGTSDLDVTLVGERCEIIDGPEAVRGSDHFPLLAELDIAAG